ncbi:arginine utilization regulatory protein [Dethiosulfatibacter aminovorans DSM 17477]|uniref:Arginine utilization regulatory protein n=1 Tax=Dethiosulfatibacter aminovorans DSM 17477 TaxID=1121476 RepID=A0A1M6BJS1_9FIRM|nr:sigma 54-interacting transcriptional regulator [Dethiosulfatibacter aminovorans]SHI48972.1 arginine utilization regulatory protein [Dethiosulfatibacter aminovorans DSM 17477]
MAVIDCICMSEGRTKLIRCFGFTEEGGEIINHIDIVEKGGLDFLENMGATDSGNVEIVGKTYGYQWIYLPDLGSCLVLSREAFMKKLYEEFMDSMDEGVQIYDKSGFTLYINRMSEEIEGISRDEFLNKHLLDLYAFDENQRSESTILSTLRHKEPILNRCDKYVTGKGKTLTTINTAKPLFMGGEIEGAALFENDFKTLNRKYDLSYHLKRYIDKAESNNPFNLYSFSDIVYKSRKMDRMINLAKKVAFNKANILICGDTGTGKELIAQAIHTYGDRKSSPQKPFVSVNCSAVPENLAESLFFGTVKGSFTGSIDSRGYFEQANGGTLFLDEVNSMSLDLQKKLLRALQEKVFRKVGSEKYEKCNIRIIASTNEPLEDLIGKGLMRKDFYFRISTVVLEVPSLSERMDDLDILVDRFIDKYNSIYGLKAKGMSNKALDVLRVYEWPGNVRELQHVVEYCFNIASKDVVLFDREHLPEYLLRTFKKFVLQPEEGEDEATEGEDMGFVSMEEDDDLQSAMEKYEKSIIMKILEEYGGNVTKTAERLNIRRQSLQYRMKKYNI